MKILLTTDLYLPTLNGVVTSVTTLRDELIRLGHEVKVLTLEQDGGSTDDPNTVYLPSLSAKHIYPYARIVRGISRSKIQLILDWQPDIVHSQCEFSSFFFARYIASRSKCPLVHTYHTNYEDYTHYIAMNKEMGKVVVKKLVHSLMKYCDGVVAPSEKTAELLRSYISTKPVFVVPTGIDLTELAAAPPPEQIDSLKTDLGLSPTSKICLYLGRIAREKNISEVLQYFAKMDRKDLSFVLIGHGPAMEEIQEEVKSFGEEIRSRIIFGGKVPRSEVPQYYHMADLFISGSTSETQGLTYFEALASGLPLLCRRDSCLIGVIEDGINGYAYDDYEDFVEKLDRILTNESFHNRSWIQKTALPFSIESFGKHIVEVYEQLISTAKSDQTLPT